MSIWKSIRSVVVFCLFLEIFFRIGGVLTQSGQFLENAFEARQKNVYRIMCIGESLTLLGGKDSYPSQLEDILNKGSGEHKKFQVINQGIGGASSDLILQRLPQWVQMYKPDMVIAMIGSLDALGDEKDMGQYQVPAFIKKIKLYELFDFLKGKIIAWTNENISKLKKIKRSPPKEKILEEPYDLFSDAMSKQSIKQKRLYFLVLAAEGRANDEIVEQLYESFLKNNSNPMVDLWVSQKYGRFLINHQEYERFVSKMDQIPYHSWDSKWIQAYCHGEDHMERVKQTIENMVTQKGVDSFIYGNVFACYQEGGRNDLAAIYFKKMGNKSSYYTQETRKNYMKIKESLLSWGIQPVFVQYPMRNISPLLSIFESDPDKEKIIFVDNESEYMKGTNQKPYEYYFEDRMFGDIGHQTPEGNHVLASDIAHAILNKIPPSN